MITRSNVSWFLLGLLNNAIFVILNAGAKDISANAVGLVYIFNTIPTLIVQGFGPYVFDRISLQTRITTCSICFICSLLSVALGTKYLSIQLCGIALGSFAQGMGEASYLGHLSQHTEYQVTLWASGTGAAGIIGYAWKVFFVDALGWKFQDCLLVAIILPASYQYIFVYMNFQSSENSHPEVASEMEYQQLTNDNPREENNNTTTLREKGKIFCSLYPYTVPLFMVYFAEYALQSGTWASFGFPIESKRARDNFYTYSNWMYQVGVWISRSSGNLFHLSRFGLFLIPSLQCLLLLFFTYDAWVHFWWNNSILLMCFVVGLFGGCVYVQTYCTMSRELDQHVEFSMSAVSVSATGGTVSGNLLGLLIQGCLYRINHIHDNGRNSPFSCGIWPNESMPEVSSGYF